MDFRTGMPQNLGGAISGGVVVAVIVFIILVVISLFWFQAFYLWLQQNGNFSPSWLFGIALIATIILLLIVYFLARCSISSYGY